MILQGRTPRSLSRIGLICMLLLGLGLLPLGPTLAQPDKPEARPVEINRGSEGKRIIAEMQSCQKCHSVPHSSAKQKVAVDKAHDEIVRLMDQVTSRRVQLRQEEAALRDALRRFEARQVPTKSPHPPMKVEGKPTDSRLEDVEKKLELLLKEVEKLRKELRPAKEGGSTLQGSKKRYMRTREFAIPVSWNPSFEGREAILYVSTDGGKSYAAAVTATFRRESGQIKSILFRAPNDGVFDFFLATVDKD